jgi:hypothetical protein
MAFWKRFFKGEVETACLRCGKNITDRKLAVKFECKVCGLKGEFHQACLHGNKLPVGGAVVISTGVICPRCAKNASTPVSGISEHIIDKIINLVNLFDYADKLGDARRIEEIKGALYQIGTMLNEQGGMDLMQQVYKRSISKGALGPKSALLNYSWNGIGQWEW